MFYVCARALLAAITAQSFAGGMSVCRDESGPAVKYRRLDCSAHKVLLGSAPTSPRGSRALSPVPTRVGFFAARRGTRSVQIYFLHLLWFLQRGPGTFLQPERGIGGVSAWNQLCQHPPPPPPGPRPGPVGFSGRERRFTSHLPPHLPPPPPPHLSRLTCNARCWPALVRL